MPGPPPVFGVKYAIFSITKIFQLVKTPPTDMNYLGLCLGYLQLWLNRILGNCSGFNYHTHECSTLGSVRCNTQSIRIEDLWFYKGNVAVVINLDDLP